MADDPVDLEINEKLKEMKSDPLKFDQICDQSIIQKAGSTLAVFRRVMEASDTLHPEVLKRPLLKNLYDLLVHLSLNPSPQNSNSRVSNYLDIGNHQFDFNVNFTQICNLANFLFNELSRRFEQLVSDLSPPQDLTMLLRCCLVILHLLVFDQSLLSEKCLILFTIVTKLCSPDLILHISCRMRGSGKASISFKRSVSHECIYASDGGIISCVEECDDFKFSVEQSGSPIPLVCSLLEVFVDELLVHRRLREYFMIINTVYCTNEKLFMCDFSHGDSDAVLEVISAHFLLLVSDEQIFNKFLSTLFWQHNEEEPILEISPVSAMQLLGTPVIFSMPKILQAYIISMVSKCVGIAMAPDNQRLDKILMNCYISVFERSFIFYDRHMSSLQLDEYPLGAQSRSSSCDEPRVLEGEFNPSFESCIRPVTYSNINIQITKITANSRHHLFPETKSDLMDASIAFMKENECILDKSHRDETCSILSCILSRTLSGETEGIGDVCLQEMYLLASIIKLMSGSLLQTIWYLQSGNSGCPKTLKDYSCCPEYDVIIGIVGCFRQYSVSHPIQKLLYGVVGTYPSRHKESKLMLMHFCCLLMYSFDRGLEFLWKGCIFMIMTLMNLFIFEEGNLDALKPLLTMECSSSPSSNKFSEALVERCSSIVIASKFQKIRMLNLRSDVVNVVETLDSQSESSNSMLIKGIEECVLNIEDDDTCNGETFIELRQGHRKPPDFDELADFVVCKRGKDYSSWLKDREKYRKWKYEKRATLMRERKKKGMDVYRRY